MSAQCWQFQLCGGSGESEAGGPAEVEPGDVAAGGGAGRSAGVGRPEVGGIDTGLVGCRLRRDRASGDFDLKRFDCHRHASGDFDLKRFDCHRHASERFDCHRRVSECLESVIVCFPLEVFRVGSGQDAGLLWLRRGDGAAGDGRGEAEATGDDQA